MNDNIPINPQTDHIGDAIAAINNQMLQINRAMADGLQQTINLVHRNDAFTRAEFYARLGNKGTSVLQLLGAYRSFLQTHAPEMITDVIAGAGAGLTPNGDGTVTVNS